MWSSLILTMAAPTSSCSSPALIDYQGNCTECLSGIIIKQQEQQRQYWLSFKWQRDVSQSGSRWGAAVRRCFKYQCCSVMGGFSPPHPGGALFLSIGMQGFFVLNVPTSPTSPISWIFFFYLLNFSSNTAAKSIIAMTAVFFNTQIKGEANQELLPNCFS